MAGQHMQGTVMLEACSTILLIFWEVIVIILQTIITLPIEAMMPFVNFDFKCIIYWLVLISVTLLII